MTSDPAVSSAPTTVKNRRLVRRFAVVAGMLMAAGFLVGWARQGESFEQHAQNAKQETERELRALATASGLEIRDLRSRRASMHDDCGWRQDSCPTEPSQGTVIFVLVRPGGASGSDRARLVQEGLAGGGYSLVAQRCNSWGLGGVFANAAGESLQVAVQYTGELVEFHATIGLDHERLTVTEILSIDRYDDTNCWPSL